MRAVTTSENTVEAEWMWSKGVFKAVLECCRAVSGQTCLRWLLYRST